MDSKLEETRPQRALTSTPFNTFGMNWNTDCELNLIAQYQCLITDANVAEWDEKLCHQLPKCGGKSSQKTKSRRLKSMVLGC